MNKNIIRLTEGDLHRIVKESVNKVLTELDWKTYASAANKRKEQEYAETDPATRGKLSDKRYALSRKARQQFDDDYIGSMKYDRMGDKFKQRHSPRFDVSDVMSPDQTLKGHNKGGYEMFSPKRGLYYANRAVGGGYTKPGTFFHDKETADAYTRANDELWDFHSGDYEYDSIKDGGEGKWVKKHK